MIGDHLFNVLFQQPVFQHPFFAFIDDSNESPQQNMFRVPRPPYTNRQFRDEEPKPMNLEKQQSTKKSKEAYSENQGQYWNLVGDECQEKRDYLKAIEHYSRAIELCEGTESTFFRNRGFAYKQLQQLDLALKDAIQAIELDDRNIKAHLLCGQVMAEIGKSQSDTQNIQTAITRLTKAMTLCAGQKRQYYESQLSQYIYRAKKLLWYKQQEISNNHKREAIGNYQKYLQSSTLSPEEQQRTFDNFIESIGNPDQQKSREIPEYLICRITLDLMENPVVTETGHSYERDVLIEHLNKNGPIDPTTRKPISGKFYPNLNVKKATEEFLLQNPWAFEFRSNEDYRLIEF